MKNKVVLLFCLLSLYTVNIFSQEVKINVKGLNLYGNLSIYNDSVTDSPLIFIIPGSGSVDRDGNNPMAKCDNIKQLSSELLVCKYSTFTYDKRGVGKSSNSKLIEENVFFENYITDIVEWYNFLKSNYKFKKIYILGHSEGSLIGILAANKLDITGLISVNGAGESIDFILKKQLSTQPEYIINMTTPIIDSLKLGYKVKNVNSLLYSLFRPSVQQYMIDWMKYEPSIELAKLNCKKLIFQSLDDLQTDSTQSELLYTRSAGNSILYKSKNSNHIFKEVKNITENMDSYNNPNYPIDKNLIEQIKKFINQ